MQERIQRFLADNRISQVSLANELGLTDAAISRRLSGATPWKLAEAQALVLFFSKLLRRPVTLDEAFGPAAPGVVATGPEAA